MDSIDIRILNLERFVIHLKSQVASTTQRALANSTVLNNSGPMAGTTSGAGSGGGGACGGLLSPNPFQLSSAGAQAGTCSNGDTGVSICANSYRDYLIGSDCTIRVYNNFSTSVQPFTTMLVSPAPDLGQLAYVVSRAT